MDSIRTTIAIKSTSSLRCACSGSWLVGGIAWCLAALSVSRAEGYEYPTFASAVDAVNMGLPAAHVAGIYSTVLGVIAFVCAMTFGFHPDIIGLQTKCHYDVRVLWLLAAVYLAGITVLIATVFTFTVPIHVMLLASALCFMLAYTKFPMQFKMAPETVERYSDDSEHLRKPTLAEYMKTTFAMLALMILVIVFGVGATNLDIASTRFDCDFVVGNCTCYSAYSDADCVARRVAQRMRIVESSRDQIVRKELDLQCGLATQKITNGRISLCENNYWCMLSAGYKSSEKYANMTAAWKQACNFQSSIVAINVDL